MDSDSDSDYDDNDNDNQYRPADNQYNDRLIDDNRNNNNNNRNNGDAELQRIIELSKKENNIRQNNELQRILELSKLENNIKTVQAAQPVKVQQVVQPAKVEQKQPVKAVVEPVKVEQSTVFKTPDKPVEPVEQPKTAVVTIKSTNDIIVERTIELERFCKYIARMISLNDVTSILINSFTEENIRKYITCEIDVIKLSRSEYDGLRKYLLAINNKDVDPQNKLYLMKITDLNE